MWQDDCNTSACDFDKGECRIVPPMDDCPHAVKCRDKVINDICNPECFSYDCYFDGGECDLCRQEHSYFYLFSTMIEATYFRDSCPVNRHPADSVV